MKERIFQNLNPCFSLNSNIFIAIVYYLRLIALFQYLIEPLQTNYPYIAVFNLNHFIMRLNQQQAICYLINLNLNWVFNYYCQMYYVYDYKINLSKLIIIMEVSNNQCFIIHTKSINLYPFLGLILNIIQINPFLFL